MELTPHWRHALGHLAPLADLLWLEGKAGVPHCLVTVPTDVVFSSVSITFATPRIECISPSVGNIVIVPFTIRISNQAPHVGWSFFNPMSQEDQHLLQALSIAREIALEGFTADEDQRFLDEQRLLWNKQQRKVMHQSLHVQGVSLPDYPHLKEQVQQKLKERVQRRLSAQYRRLARAGIGSRWRLSPAIVDRLLSPSTRALAVLPDTRQQQDPWFLLKVPAETDFTQVAVGFGPFNIFEYPTGKILCLQIKLQDHEQRTLAADCLFYLDAGGDLPVLEKLATTTTVEIVAVADGDAFPLMGAKRLPWPAQKQQRAQQFVRWLKTRIKHPQPERVAPYGLSAAEQYRRSHPYDTAFRPAPVSAAPQQTRSGLFLPTLGREANQDYEVILGGPSLLAPRDASEQPLGAVIEQFRAKQWALAEAARKQAKTVSLVQGWHVLLAGAAEQARKLLWTPEAIGLLEQQRLPLRSIHDAIRLLPQTQLWCEWTLPLETPVGRETAALLLVDLHDHQFIRRLSEQVPGAAQALSLLGHALERPGQRLLVFNIINRGGDLVWALGFALRERRQQHAHASWFLPVWYRCLSGRCQSVLSQPAREPGSRIAALCPPCQDARDYFTTWLATAWHLVHEAQHDASQDEQMLPTSEDDDIAGRTSLPLVGGQAKLGTHDNERYRVVRSIDLSASPPSRGPRGPKDSRGSWVEALLSQDPAFVHYEQREIPTRIRTLRHLRYAAYIARAGTNKVEVRAHTKGVPLRVNAKGYTKVRVKNRDRQEKQEGN